MQQMGPAARTRRRVRTPLRKSPPRGPRVRPWRRVPPPMGTLNPKRATHFPWQPCKRLRPRRSPSLAAKALPNWPRAGPIAFVIAAHEDPVVNMNDAVSGVIEVAADQPAVALDRLQRLIESWGPNLAPVAREDAAGAAAAASAAAPATVLPAVSVPAAPAAAPAATAATLEGARARSADLERDAQLVAARSEADAWKQVALRSIPPLEQNCGAGQTARTKLREYTVQPAAPLTAEDIARLVPRFADTVAVIERQIAEERNVRIGLQRL